MGGMDVNVQGPAQANVIPDEAYDYLAKNDPTNPALQGAMSRTQYLMQQQKAQETARVTAQKKAQEAEKAAAKQEEERKKKMVTDYQAGLLREFMSQGGLEEEMPEVNRKIELGETPLNAMKEVLSRREKSGQKDEQERLRKVGLVTEYNKALTVYKGVDADDAKAKVAAEAALAAAGDALKAEGIEPPAGFKPVDIYQFQKKAGPATTAPSSVKPKISPEDRKALEDELNDPSTPPEDKAKLRAILGDQVGEKPLEFGDDQAMGDLRLTGMHPAPAPPPNTPTMPTTKEDDAALRRRQRALYAEISSYNSLHQDAPPEIMKELNQIDAILKKRGYGSFHGPGMVRFR
jgi:hypothetical protein